MKARAKKIIENVNKKGMTLVRSKNESSEMYIFEHKCKLSNVINSRF